MKNYLYQFFVKKLKNWTKFELILWASCIVAVCTISIIFKSGVLIATCSLIGAASTFLQAKGKAVAQIFAIITVVLYSLVSYAQGLYGEVLTYVVLMLPLAIASLISWVKNTDEEKTVKVRELNKKQLMMLPLYFVAEFVVVYFILKAINTSFLFASTLSVATSVISVVLMIIRSKYGFVSFFIDEMTSIILWSFPIIVLGNLTLLPLLINPIVNSINHLYGWKVWSAKIKRQREKKLMLEKELQASNEVEQKS
ncbi:MAG: nicotinamide riboside transporter PnuC [Clostridia bacterium]|nr:nicotinamide riboside transporter PnuC [Clostridia bacterium]